MGMSREEIALWVIVAQGFAIMYFEAAVWYMKYRDWMDKKIWREKKRVAVLKKLEIDSSKPCIELTPLSVMIPKEEPRE